MMQWVLSILLLSMVVSGEALASEPPPYSCRNGLFSAAAPFQLAHVQNIERLHFHRDDQGCPAGPNCRTPSYLIPGDMVIVNQRTPRWACVWYEPLSENGHETVGWVEQAYLKHQLPKPLKPLDWQGKWQARGTAGFIQITPESGGLQATGEAFWLGPVLPSGDRVIHTGGISARGVPKQNLLFLNEGDDPYSCHLQLTLLPPFLIAHDNGHCGGMNVRFDGIYLRKP